MPEQTQSIEKSDLTGVPEAALAELTQKIAQVMTLPREVMTDAEKLVAAERIRQNFDAQFNTDMPDWVKTSTKRMADLQRFVMNDERCPMDPYFTLAVIDFLAWHIDGSGAITINGQTSAAGIKKELCKHFSRKRKSRKTGKIEVIPIHDNNMDYLWAYLRDDLKIISKATRKSKGSELSIIYIIE